jgi:hypothetical protein
MSVGGLVIFTGNRTGRILYEKSLYSSVDYESKIRLIRIDQKLALIFSMINFKVSIIIMQTIVFQTDTHNLLIFKLHFLIQTKTSTRFTLFFQTQTKSRQVQHIQRNQR